MPKAKNTKIPKNETTEKVPELLKQPYARILTPDTESGTYAAQILEFPGCVAQGDTPDEAYANLENAAEGWIEAALDLGQEIPEPFMSQGFGGKIALRLPRSIHRQAALMAEQDGTSLNQFLLAAVSERVGAINLYTHMMEQLAQQTAQIMVSVETTNLAINQSVTQYIPSSFLPYPFPPEFIVNIDAITPAQSYTLPRPQGGNQQHA